MDAQPDNKELMDILARIVETQTATYTLLVNGFKELGQVLQQFLSDSKETISILEGINTKLNTVQSYLNEINTRLNTMRDIIQKLDDISRKK
jgi:ABC-type transporter Mla subunit MlaD